jgi:hypothetical protein
MHDAGSVRANMRQSVALLLLLAAGACGSTTQTGKDGGGGSGGGGTGGNGGTAGSSGGGTGGCAPNQVWCPGCEPGTGACYAGGCPGVACPPLDGGTAGAGGVSGSGGTAGSGGTGGAGVCGARACTSSELCVHPSCGGAPPQCTALPDGGQCPTGWTYRAVCSTIPVPGPGCEEPPCTPPSPYCFTRPSSCGATPTCSCLPANVCQGGGACGFINTNGEVLCLSA